MTRLELVVMSDSRPPTDIDINEKPGFALVYLVFAYVPLLFMERNVWAATWPTLLATAAFVPLHFGFHRHRCTGSPGAWILAVAALGYALIPFNLGGNTFIIYACAMSARALRPRAALWLGLALGAVMAAEFLWVIPLPRVAGAVSGITFLMGAIVMAGILYARARAREHWELRLTQEEVRRLAGVAERERIARDLHDVLGHTLSLVALKSELAGKLLDRDPAAARVQIREVESVAREALSQVRDAVAGIRAAGLEAELASARLALLAADVRLDQRLTPFEASGDVENALALVVREAITNIIRHAQAHRVEIELSSERDGLRLSIADDGRGGIERHGHGLDGMRQRAAAIGGALEIDSPRGGGTRLVLRAPRGHTEATP